MSSVWPVSLGLSKVVAEGNCLNQDRSYAVGEDALTLTLSQRERE